MHIIDGHSKENPKLQWSHSITGELHSLLSKWLMSGGCSLSHTTRCGKTRGVYYHGLLLEQAPHMHSISSFHVFKNYSQGLLVKWLETAKQSNIRTSK